MICPIFPAIEHCKVYNIHSVDHPIQCFHNIQCFSNDFQHLLWLVYLVVTLHVNLVFLFVDWTSFWGHLLPKQNRESSSEGSPHLSVLMKKHLVYFSPSSAFWGINRSLAMSTYRKRGSCLQIMNSVSARSWLRCRFIFWFLYRSPKLVDNHFLNERCIIFFAFLIFPCFFLLFKFLLLSFSHFFYLFKQQMYFCFKLGQFWNKQVAYVCQENLNVTRQLGQHTQLAMNEQVVECKYEFTDSFEHFGAKPH